MAEFTTREIMQFFMYTSSRTYYFTQLIQYEIEESDRIVALYKFMISENAKTCKYFSFTFKHKFYNTPKCFTYTEGKTWIFNFSSLYIYITKTEI